jgi:hypothetical protein
MSADQVMQQKAAAWKSQLRDALWRRPSAPLNWRSIAREMLAYGKAISWAAVLAVCTGGFLSNTAQGFLVAATVLLLWAMLLLQMRGLAVARANRELFETQSLRARLAALGLFLFHRD